MQEVQEVLASDGSEARWVRLCCGKVVFFGSTGFTKRCILVNQVVSDAITDQRLTKRDIVNRNLDRRSWNYWLHPSKHIVSSCVKHDPA